MTIALAALRTLIGLVFVVAAIGEFVAHSQVAVLFGRWDLPAPEISSYVIASIEVVCGVLVMLGALVRPAALVLATIMVGEAATAGRVDGGMYLIVPPILFLILVFFAWRSGRPRAWSPKRRPGTQ